MTGGSGLWPGPWQRAGSAFAPNDTFTVPYAHGAGPGPVIAEVRYPLPAKVREHRTPGPPALLRASTLIPMVARVSGQRARAWDAHAPGQPSRGDTSPRVGHDHERRPRPRPSGRYCCRLDQRRRQTGRTLAQCRSVRTCRLLESMKRTPHSGNRRRCGAAQGFRIGTAIPDDDQSGEPARHAPRCRANFLARHHRKV